MRSTPAAAQAAASSSGGLGVPSRSASVGVLRGATVDIGPGRRMDDDLGPVPLDRAGRRAAVVEVVVGPGPGDRAGQPGERGVGQGRDERPAEPPAGAGDRDRARQSASTVRRLGGLPAGQPARPYWRS